MIKKHPSGNRYLYTESGMWVRDFTAESPPVDINNLTEKKDYSLFIENDAKNNMVRLQPIDQEQVRCPNCVIVSDGYKFDELHLVLAELPKNTTVIAVNNALAKWKANRRIDYFVVNNPYESAMAQLPRHAYFPTAVVSTKVFPKFLQAYRKLNGLVFSYVPTPEMNYKHSAKRCTYHIDDYRNPICAAIGLAFRFGVRRLALVGCDEAFEHERPAAEQLPNGLWMYPQHRVVNDLITASVYWLSNYELYKISVVNCSAGPDIVGAPYISKDELKGFFA